jgi:nucleotide-binding universal stress UspA family protein
VLAWVERFPGIVYVGAGVLAWTAARMIAAEPFLKDAFAASELAAPLLALLLAAGVVWGGFVRNHRRLESRIHARLAQFSGRGLAAARNAFTEEGADPMLRILLPTDGSRNAGFAARHVVQEFLKSSDMEVHLLNVQPPFSRHIAAFASKKSRDAFHRDRAANALAPAREILDAHRVPYVVHVELGDKARVIAEAARRLRCHHIVMSTARKNSLTRMLEDSVTNRVLELTHVPVELIAGDEISKAERYGVPAGIGALLAMLLFAALD